jgi:hypothetical protein
MVNERMDQSQLYEWVIIEHRTGVKNGSITRTIKSLCVTEPVRINEVFYTGDSETCPALTQRIAQLYPGDTKTPPAPGEAFRVGNKVWAKVQATVASDGTVTWAFAPYSFTMLSTTPESYMPSTTSKSYIESTRQQVTKAVTGLKSRKDIMTKLEQMGAEYVREYRKMEAEGKV